MHRRLILILLYFGLAITILVLQTRYTNIILACLTLLFSIFLVYDYYSLAKRRFKGEVIFHRKRQPARYEFILLALLAVVITFAGGKFNYFQASCLLLVSLFEFITGIITAKTNPALIIIDGDTLQINDHRLTTRNLALLSGLTLNGFSEELLLTFNGQHSLRIRVNDLSEQDFRLFISICRNKSREQLFITPNLLENSAALNS